MYNDLEDLEEQWQDVVTILDYVADRLVDEAMTADAGKQERFMDAVRGVQATKRQAHKVNNILGWGEQGEVE